MYLFCSDQRKTFCKIKTHLITKNTSGSCARSVTFIYSVFYNIFKQRKVVLHACKLMKKIGVVVASGNGKCCMGSIVHCLSSFVYRLSSVVHRASCINFAKWINYLPTGNFRHLQKVFF